MGQSYSSHADNNVFAQELKKLNTLVTDIIAEDDIFKNKNYNFLSQDVCESYQVILQEELNKHLKLDIKDLGSSLYIIPKTDENESKLTAHKLTKREVCDKISSHYIKILYIMCLVKYVYNLEKGGDLSISGIIFRNIKIVDDMMQIYFCGLPHKKYTNTSPDAYKMDFSQLEGMKFFAEYFLSPDESATFLGILRSVLARSSPAKIQQRMCHYIDQHGVKDLPALQKLYESRYPKRNLKCVQRGGNNHLYMYIEKDNPIFLSDYCGAPIKVVVKLNTQEGKRIFAYYKKMHANYKDNVDQIQKLVSQLVSNIEGQYELKDVTKYDLDKIIEQVKLTIKQFYIQSIFDFQNLLDMAKSTPNIHVT
jgi:hypothetical protein